MKRLPYYIVVIILSLVLVACVRPLSEDGGTDDTAPDTNAPLDAFPGSEGATDNANGQETFTFDNTGTDNAGTEDANTGQPPAEGDLTMDGTGGEGTVDNGGGENAGTVEQPPIVDPVVQPSADVVHTIVNGDLLGRIAEQYGVSVEDIMIANGLDNPDRLAIGDQLTIPLSGNVTPPAGAGASNGGGSGVVHTVQPGETLYSIGLRYGKTVEDLAAFNGIVDVHTLEVGQQVSIP